MKGPLIYCDHAEERSGIPDRLRQSGCSVEVERLDTADYLLSSALAVERKASRDLVDSILSGRLWEQVDRMCTTYECGVLLIEGDAWAGDLRLKAPMLGAVYHESTVRENFQIIYSPDETVSSRLLSDLARRDQSEHGRPAPRTAAPKARKPEHVVEAIPGVGPKGARALIDRFRTVRGVVTATEKELQTVIGPKRGAAAYELLTRDAGPR